MAQDMVSPCPLGIKVSELGGIGNRGETKSRIQQGDKVRYLYLRFTIQKT